MLLSGFALSLSPLTEFLALYFYIGAAFTVGFDVVIAAVNGIVHGHILDEHFLMSAGSICAFVLGEYAEGTFILLFYQVGELFQSVAVGKARNSIAALMDIRPDFARLLKDNQVLEVDPYDVKVGDIILIEPGDKVPLDGIIIEGESSFDTASLTGESVPARLAVGDNVISGFVNLDSPIKVRVLKEFEESTVSKILELAENASTKKAKAENFVTTFAKYYTPAVVIAAVLVATVPPLFLGGWSSWIIRAVMFVVISCPCALVVSVPMAFFGALGGASREGILVKGSCYLETLANADTFIFDKTGTLTSGKFSVSEICPEKGVLKEELLRIAAICESHSPHPIAAAIKAEFGENLLECEDFLVVSGKGVVCTFNGEKLLAGNQSLLEENGLTSKKVTATATTVHVAKGGEYLGYILIEDQIKIEATSALSDLKNAGAKRLVMLTGDNSETAQAVAEKLNINDLHSSLLPADKVSITEELLSTANGKVAFVGDGVNDAPVLARADLGIAMGGLGSDAAIEAADIVIMNDDLRLIPKAVKIAKRALLVSKQNISLAILVKFAVLILSTVGLSNIWLAVFADVGVLILAILNSLRTLTKIK